MYQVRKEAGGSFFLGSCHIQLQQFIDGCERVVFVFLPLLGDVLCKRTAGARAGTAGWNESLEKFRLTLTASFPLNKGESREVGQHLRYITSFTLIQKPIWFVVCLLRPVEKAVQLRRSKAIVFLVKVR